MTKNNGSSGRSPAMLHISDEPIYVREVVIKGRVYRFPYHNPSQLARLYTRLIAEGQHHEAEVVQRLIDQYL